MILLHTNRVHSLLFTLLIFLSVFFKATTGYSVKDNQYNNESQEKFQDNQKEITSTPVLINTLSHSHKLERNKPIDTTYYHSADNSKRVLVTRNDRIANIWLRKHQNFELMYVVEFTTDIGRVNFNKDASKLCILPDFYDTHRVYNVQKDNYYMEICSLHDNILIRKKIKLDFKGVDCQCFNPIDKNELFIIQDGMIIIFKHDNINGWQEKERIGESKDHFEKNYRFDSIDIDYSTHNIFYYGYYGFDGKTIILRGEDAITILTKNQHGSWDIADHKLNYVFALMHSSTKNEFISIADTTECQIIEDESDSSLLQVQHWYLDSDTWHHTKVAECSPARLLSCHFSPDQNGFFLGFDDNTAQVFSRNENNDWLISKIERWRSFDQAILHSQSTPYSNDGQAIISKDKAFPVFIKNGNTWNNTMVLLGITNDSSELLSLQMSPDNQRLIAVFVTRAANKRAKYEIRLLLKCEAPSCFICKTTVELDSLASKVFFIDNSHFAVVHSNDVRIYEIPAVDADSEVVEVSME